MANTTKRAEETQAIEALFRAERDAERVVAEAERQAEKLLSDARQRARAIAERTDERITKIHARAAALSERAIAELDEEVRDRERASRRSLTNETLIDRAVERVADWLLAEEGK